MTSPAFMPVVRIQTSRRDSFGGIAMNLYLHNPLAEMYGPYFLIVYGMFIVAVLVGIRFWVASHDSTDELDPVPVPEDPDPYEIAYLRGGVNELIRVVVFDLLQRGFLERREEKSAFGLIKKNKIAQADAAASWSDLTPIEARVFGHFAVPREPSAVFEATFTESLESECTGYASRLEQAQLLQRPEQKAAAAGALFGGGALIAGLGCYKFCAALLN